MWIILLAIIGTDLESAVADRTKLYDVHTDVNSRFFYFSFEMVPEARRESVITTFRYAIGSTSKTSHVESFLPVAITPTLYRIDVLALGWKYETFRKHMSRSDYKRAVPTTKTGVYEKADVYLVNHPWFIMELLDATESRVYFELLFGKDAPTKQDFLKSAKTIEDPNLLSQRIEGDSGVAVVGTRNLYFLPNGIGTLTTFTGDRSEITAENSPLQSLDKGPDQQKIEALEAIYAHEIFSSTQQRAGWINRYWIGNGKGEFQANGDEQVVSNSFGWRGHHTIVVPGGCVVCHQNGLNPITTDAFRQYLDAGGEFRVKDYQDLVRLERQYLMPINKRIDRYNEDFAAGIELLTGKATKDFIQDYRACIDWLDDEVDIEQAARELYTDWQSLKLAIAIQDPYKLHEGLVRLAHGAKIPRSLWADLYFETSIYLEQWKP